LETRWFRHKRNADLLVEGAKDLGLSLFGEDDVRASVITAIDVPDVSGGVDAVGLDSKVRRLLSDVFKISISGGLGVFKGKLWRVGLMGLNSTEDNVYLFLDALEKILKKEKIFEQI
jgi:alanine-glyoxylate transaminase/serine-glyoxylate transaminase/serine-pyruvate transaminase